MDALFVKLARLSIRIEGKGQYNIAKFIRATLDSLLRKSAFELGYATDTADILKDMGDIITALEEISFDGQIIQSLKAGYQKIAANEISKIPEFPQPIVCRRCGNTTASAGEKDFPRCATCGADIDSFVIHRPIYWMREFDPLECLLHLEKTPRKYASLLASLPEQDHAAKPSPGDWSVLEVVKHVKDAESVLQFRVKRILEQDNPYLDFQKVWDWADKPASQPETAADLLRTYQHSRAATIAILQDTPLKNWWRTATHEEFGPVNLIGQVSYFAAHEISHLRQMATRIDPKFIAAP